MTQKTIDFGFEDIPESQKASRVRGVFDSVAGNYDLMNDAMSLGVHRVWKNMVMAKLNPQPGEVLLDVAGGTGDLARRFIVVAEDVRMRRGGDAARAVICDINAEMLLAGIDKKKDNPVAVWASWSFQRHPRNGCVNFTMPILSLSFRVWGKFWQKIVTVTNISLNPFDVSRDRRNLPIW